MDSLRLPGEIRIIGAHDDPGMRHCAPLVQPQKVAPVLSKENSRFGCSEREDFFVRRPAVCFSGFVGGQYVVTQPPEFPDHLKRDILVRVNARHQADSLSRIWASISAGCALTNAQAFARSSACSDG